jgi:hypothetical protein
LPLNLFFRTYVATVHICEIGTAIAQNPPLKLSAVSHQLSARDKFKSTKIENYATWPATLTANCGALHCPLVCR